MAILSSTYQVLGELSANFERGQYRLLSPEAHIPLLHVHRYNTGIVPLWSSDCERAATAILPKHGYHMRRSRC